MTDPPPWQPDFDRSFSHYASRQIKEGDTLKLTALGRRLLKEGPLPSAPFVGSSLRALTKRLASRPRWIVGELLEPIEDKQAGLRGVLLLLKHGLADASLTRSRTTA
jgi:hypothetical protein